MSGEALTTTIATKISGGSREKDARRICSMAIPAAAPVEEDIIPELVATTTTTSNSFYSISSQINISITAKEALPALEDNGHPRYGISREGAQATRHRYSHNGGRGRRASGRG